MAVVPLQQALVIAGDHHRHGRLVDAQTIYARMGHRVVKLGDDLIVDFWNLAGFLRQMDLVISVDTAVCHLAGALGLPMAANGAG